MNRHHLPALLTVGLIATLAVLEWRHAYEEGLECRERGGVIIESDPSVESSAEVKLCTADYGPAADTVHVTLRTPGPVPLP